MMNLQKYINSLLQISVVLSPSLIIISALSLPLPAQANTNIQLPTAPPERGTPQRTIAGGRRIKFPSTPDRGTPQRTGGAGRRGNSCILTDNGQPSLKALMPTSDNQGQTVSDNPILYIYVPKTSAKTGEFVVIDKQGNEVYQTNFTSPNQPGIVQLSIPDSADLKVGQEYEWYFNLICNPEDRSQDQYVFGFLKRTTLGSLLNNSLEQTEPLQRAEIYANQKIWYDTISNVAAVKNEYPEVWTELLQSVGLEAFAKEPFVELGKPEP